MKLVLVSENKLIKINDYIILWQNYLRNNVQTFITIGLVL